MIVSRCIYLNIQYVFGIYLYVQVYEVYSIIYLYILVHTIIVILIYMAGFQMQQQRRIRVRLRPDRHSGGWPRHAGAAPAFRDSDAPSIYRF